VYEVLDQPSCDRGREQTLARGHRPDRLGELSGTNILEQESACTLVTDPQHRHDMGMLDLGCHLRLP